MARVLSFWCCDPQSPPTSESEGATGAGVKEEESSSINQVRLVVEVEARAILISLVLACFYSSSLVIIIRPLPSARLPSTGSTN
eukprot:scaffold175713_cov45-Attheya_sp.AAC.2